VPPQSRGPTPDRHAQRQNRRAWMRIRSASVAGCRAALWASRDGSHPNGRVRMRREVCSPTADVRRASPPRRRRPGSTPPRFPHQTEAVLPDPAKAADPALSASTRWQSGGEHGRQRKRYWLTNLAKPRSIGLPGSPTAPIAVISVSRSIRYVHSFQRSRGRCSGSARKFRWKPHYLVHPTGSRVGPAQAGRGLSLTKTQFI